MCYVFLILVHFFKASIPKSGLITVPGVFYHDAYLASFLLDFRYLTLHFPTLTPGHTSMVY